MLERYMRKLAKRDCPVVLSITDTVQEIKVETVIHRNQVSEAERERPSEIYLRAREIYFRARRTRPVRAASIF